MFRLAATLGRFVGELDGMSAHELQEWAAYDRMEGLPVQRNAYGHAYTAAAVAGLGSGKFDPDSFLIDLNRQPDPQQSETQMKAVADGLMRALKKFGGA